MTFRVGQKVVYVRRGAVPAYMPKLVVNDIYEVTKTAVSSVSGKQLVMVNGYEPVSDGIAMRWYHAYDFRPVQEQGMSILRSIAANPKQKIRELA